MSLERVLTADWPFWLLFFVVILFILWLFFGGGDYEYIGLSPLNIGVDSNKYVNDHTYRKIERDNYNAKKVCSDTSVPSPDTSDTSDTTDTLRQKPKKKVSKGERICRQVLEELYGKPFPCTRPDFLKNPETKRNLELDCYNKDLKLAVEYSGKQHYVWPNFTGQSKENFIKQIRRDRYKREACDANGVYLITVPYNVPHKKIKDYIIKYLPHFEKTEDICYYDEF